MTPIATQVLRLSNWYDQNKPGVTTIKVNCTRQTALKFARPKERGGPLYFRGRQIIHKPKRRPGDAVGEEHGS